MQRFCFLVPAVDGVASLLIRQGIRPCGYLQVVLQIFSIPIHSSSPGRRANVELTDFTGGGKRKIRRHLRRVSHRSHARLGQDWPGRKLPQRASAYLRWGCPSSPPKTSAKPNVYRCRSISTSAEKDLIVADRNRKELDVGGLRASCEGWSNGEFCRKSTRSTKGGQILVN